MWFWVVGLLSLAVGLACWIVAEHRHEWKKRQQLLDEAANDIARLAVARAGGGTNEQSATTLDFCNCGAAMAITVGLNLKAQAKQATVLKQETYDEFLKEVQASPDLTAEEKAEWPKTVPEEGPGGDVDPEDSWMRNLDEKGLRRMHFVAVKRAKYLLLNWDFVHQEYNAKSRLRALNLVSERQYADVCETFHLFEEELLRIQYDSECLHGNSHRVLQDTVYFIQDHRRKMALAAEKTKEKLAQKKAAKAAELAKKNEEEKKLKQEKERKKALEQILQE